MSKQAAAGVEEASKGTSKDTPKTAQAGPGLAGRGKADCVEFGLRAVKLCTNGGIGRSPGQFLRGQDTAITSASSSVPKTGTIGVQGSETFRPLRVWHAATCHDGGLSWSTLAGCACR